jgi:hypothetical protein
VAPVCFFLSAGTGTSGTSGGGGGGANNDPLGAGARFWNRPGAVVPQVTSSRGCSHPHVCGSLGGGGLLHAPLCPLSVLRA